MVSQLVKLACLSTALAATGVVAQQQAWQQCGGIGWGGGTTCVSGYYCNKLNDYYSQCVPGQATNQPSTTTTRTTTTTTTTRPITTTTTTPAVSTTCTVADVTVTLPDVISYTTIQPPTVTVTVNDEQTTTRATTTTTTTTRPITTTTTTTTTVSPTPTSGATPKNLAFVSGTDYRGKGPNVGVYDWNPSTGTLTYISTATGANAGSMMVVSDDLNFLYICNEQTNNYCSVTTFRINSNKSITKISDYNFAGYGAAFIALDPTRKYLALSCYNTGNTGIVSIGSNGAPNALVDNEYFTGSGPNSSRQSSAHNHQIVWSADQRFAYVPDLGADKIWINTYSNGQITKSSSASLPAGAGPRHFVLHPTLPVAYSIQELANTVATYSYDRTSGSLTYQSSLSALPSGFTGTSAGAEILLHPSLPYVYATNRGANTIAVFRIGSNGALTKVADVNSGGRTPRHIVFRDGWLVCANSDTSSVTVFRVGSDGIPVLSSTTSNLPVPPYAIAFA